MASQSSAPSAVYGSLPVDSITKKAKARGREAMWSVACNSQLLSPALMPAAARPIALNDALDVLPRLTDEHAGRRAIGAVLLLVQAGSRDAEHAAQVMEAFGDLDLGPVIDILPQLLSLGLVINGLLFLRLFMFALEWNTCGCKEPLATGTYSAIGRVTTLTSELVINKTLDQVAPLLDPRSWAGCGQIFKKSYEVVERGDRYVPHDNGIPVGQSWCGLLHEGVAVGPIRSSNILQIHYTVNTGPCPYLRVGYRLRESLKYEFAGLKLAGLPQMDHGSIDVTEYVDAHGTSQTKLVAKKTVQFGRVSRWSGGGAYDYGEILNYLAPAIMTLWTDDLRRVVPCC